MRTPGQRGTLPALVGLALALVASLAGGQTIFRCGDSYSQSPCANARVLDGIVPPTEAQRTEARAVAAREKLLAFEMVQDRRERESALRPALAVSLSPSPPARPASAPTGTKKHAAKKKRAALEDGRDFVAAVPRAKK